MSQQPSIGGLMSSVASPQTAAPMEGFAVPSGIYQITNKVNGKRYIGSAVNLKKRWWNHLSSLRHGQHANQHLQHAFEKYGKEAFAFSILEHVQETDKLIEREQHYLNTLSPEYNISPIAGSPLGVRHTQQARRNMSEAHKGERGFWYGKHLSQETRRKLSEAHMGKRHSEESRRKMSEAHTGKYLGEETRRKISAAQRGELNHMYGKHHSQETRKRMSEALREKCHYMYGKHHSKERRQKISKALKGRRPSEEVRRKMSEAQKQRWSKKRAQG